MTTIETERPTTEFIGPLPVGLVRDRYDFHGVRIGHTKDAREFVIAAANFMRHIGREVEITEKMTDYGFVSINAFAPAPNWYDTSVSVTAFQNGARWRFAGASTLGKTKDAKTYRAATSLIEVYGR